jgi:hypothetical protein
MAAKILRWSGGAGGDMILYLKSLGSPESVVNIKYTAIESNGKTGTDFSKVNWATAKNIDKIANADYLDHVNIQELSSELDEYCSLPNHQWFKSHYYTTDLFDNFTIDIVADDIALPFVVASNIDKTTTVDINFNVLASKIIDPIVKVNYSMYCVAVDHIRKQTVGTQHINVSALLENEATFDSVLKKYQFDIDSKFYYVYNTWLDSNKKNVPSGAYQNKVINKDYDFNNPELTLAERYSLMALAGNKFVNLC